jgi:hypothetical protein
VRSADQADTFTEKKLLRPFMFMDCVMISFAFVASLRLSRLVSDLFERILAILFCVAWFVLMLALIIWSLE